MSKHPATHPNEAGWLSEAIALPSPHYDERPPSSDVVLAVIHAISLPAGCFGGVYLDYVCALLCGRLDPLAEPDFADLAGLRVSAHFLIDRQGRLFQLVDCDRRAWHAGVSHWQGRERCNDYSIGIELEGDDEHAFTDAQYAALTALLNRLQQRYPHLAHLAGHCHIAPGRKTDPGPHFDWRRLLAALPTFDGTIALTTLS